MLPVIAGVALWLTVITGGESSPPGWQDRDGPYQVASFRADSDLTARSGITCEGEYPGGLSPEVATQSYVSLLQMCAHEQFGGRVGMNAGAFCDNRADPASIAFQGFSKWPPMASEYLRMICQIKCRCASGFSQRPARGPILINALGDQLRFVDFDRDGPVVVSKVKRPARFSSPTFKLDIELGPLEKMQTIRKEYLYANPNNRLRCNSIMLRQIVLENFHDFWSDVSPIRDAEALCSATIVGGNPEGNVGGLCIRNRNIGSILPEVYFLDEFVHPNYGWDRGSWPKILRLACFAACHCDFGQFPKAYLLARTCPWLSDSRSIETWIKFAKDHIAPKGDDEIDSDGSDNDSAGNSSLSCATGQRGCEPKLLGVDKQCKASCTSISDWCGSGSCKCVATSRFGSSFLASCLALSGRLMNKRSELACPCNSTYVSKACCASRDGVLWESPALKLGELK